MDTLQPRVQISEAENVPRAHYIRDVVSQKSFDGFSQVSENLLLDGIYVTLKTEFCVDQQLTPPPL